MASVKSIIGQPVHIGETEGHNGWRGHWAGGILRGAAKDADALEFVEFLVSPEAQEYFVEETYEYPLVGSVEAPEGLPALDSLVNPDLDLADLESLEATQELLSRYGLI